MRRVLQAAWTPSAGGPCSYRRTPILLQFIPLFRAGLYGLVDPLKVTIMFTWYIVADFTWILVEPDAVPSMPNVILLHHVVTFVLLCFPLRYPHLALYTCWVSIHIDYARMFQVNGQSPSPS